MEIDNPRKRCRDSSEEDDFISEQQHKVHAKKTRQFDAFAAARDSLQMQMQHMPPSPGSDATADSASSSPPPMADDDMMMMEVDDNDEAQWDFPEPKPAPQTRSTIISALNQARRDEDLRVKYPWLFR
ncbi:hypothetical protein OQA88_11311 [Cercophora sp. LCS_1]